MKMKKTFKFLTLTVLLSMVGVLSAFATKVTDLTFVKDGLTYKVLSIEWGVNGSKTSKGTVSVEGNDKTKTSINIVGTFKETLTNTYEGEGEGVYRNDEVTFTTTTIVKDAFKGMNKVTSLTIPGTVTTIDEGAFANLTGLTTLKIGTASEKSSLVTIGDFAFGNCPITTLDLEDCPNLNLKDGRPLINAFGRENNQLTTVKLPKEISEIGTAFAGLSKLENLDLSKTHVSSLDAGALTGTSIKEITLARPVDPTDATISIGENALPKTLEKLTVLGDLGPNAITAQPGLDKLKELRLHGALQGAYAIPTNAFPDSPLEILAIGGRSTNPGDGITVAGAIAPNAFGNKTLKTINFNGPIAEGGISNKAFEGAGACAKVNFNGVLNKNAIGAEAFKSASISELNFKKELKSYAIANNAFEAIVCDANVDFIGKVGDHAVGTAAFTLAQLGSVTFEKALSTDGAIRAEAFKGATLKGDLTFKGAITGYHSIGKNAFEEADLQGNIVFGGDINHDEAISTEAFKNFTNSAAGTTPITFKNIIGKKAIMTSAFEGGAVASVTVNGKIMGDNAIFTDAFKGTPMTELTVTGEIRGTDAISEGAFANNAKLGLIDLQGTLVADQGSAIALGAFAYAAIETNGGAVLNAGNIIKTPAAIAAGAFGGASLSVVNFKELMVQNAIAANQFGPMNQPWSSRQMLPSSEGALPAATIGTVNFLNELKDWTSEGGSSENFVGVNAFTGTGVKVVNFVKVSTKNAIVVNMLGDNVASLSPFADNGAEMTINFNGDVCTGGFGQYAFSNSNTRKIVLNNNNEFAKLAFSKYAFLNIALENDAQPGNTKIVTIEYTAPATGIGVYRTFDLQDFYESLTNVDIKFVTTDKVKQMYSTDVNAEDLTPYRLKFIVTKLIEMNKITDDFYYGYFDPQDEQYIIEKYQENGYDEATWQGPNSHTGAIAGVYSAYADDQTLVQMEGYNFPAALGGKPLYYADLYLNPLRVQEKGKYVLNQGHTFIVTSNKPDPVVATQDDGNIRDGGVQTFAGLSPWACNDLRWNPSFIYARYDADGNKINGMFTEVGEKEGCFRFNDEENKFEWAGLNTGNFAVKPGHEWDGEVFWTAIDNGDVDFYGNVVRNYQIFVSNPGSWGFEFANAPLIPASSAYVLVGAYGDTDANKYSVQEKNRINYSGNNIYPTFGEDPTAELIAQLKEIVEAHDSETPSEYSGLEDWVKKVLDLAWMSGYGYRVSGDQTGTHVSDNDHKEAIEDAFKTLFGELQTKVVTDEETGETNTLYFYDIMHAGTIKGLFDKFKDLCDAKQDVVEAETALGYEDIIRCVEEDDELLGEYAGEKFSTTLENLEGEIEELEGQLHTDILAQRAEQDDMYQQYLALKDAVGDADAAALLAEYNGLSDASKAFLALSTRDRATLNSLPDKTAMQAFARNYAAWAEIDFELDMPFDLEDLQTAAAASGTDLDAVVNIDPELGDIDMPSTFKQDLDEAAAEAEKVAAMFDAYNEAAEGLDEDGHVMAAFKNMLWQKTNHYTMTIWSGNTQYATAEKTVDVVAYRPNGPQDLPEYYNDGLNNYEVRAITVVGEDDVFEADGIYGVIEGAYADSELSSVYAKQIVKLTSGGEWELISAAPWATLVTTPNETLEYNPKNLYKNNPTDNSTVESLYSSHMEDLFDAQGNILNVDEDNLDVEATSFYNLAKSMKDLLDNGLIETEQVETQYESFGAGYDTEHYPNMFTFDIDDIEEAAEEAAQDAKDARAAAAAWLIKWYAQAVHSGATTIDEESTYSMVAADLKTQAAIDAKQAIIDAIKDLPCYEAYELAVAALETAKGDEETAGVALKNFIAGQYNQDVTALANAISKVNGDIIEKSVNAGARLNIIWNDRPEEVVGIMEAVVNKAAAAAVKGNAIYNLNGMRVNKAQKGIYIQNGKKVVVK